jgi:hypothetical protein
MSVHKSPFHRKDAKNINKFIVRKEFMQLCILAVNALLVGKSVCPVSAPGLQILSLIHLLLNGIQLTITVKVQDVNPLPLIRTVIHPVIAILRRRRAALLEDLFRGLPYVLIVADGGITTGNRPGVHGSSEQQSRASENKKIMDFHGDFSHCLLLTDSYQEQSTA